MRTDTFRPPILRPTVYLFVMVRLIVLLVAIGIAVGFAVGIATIGAGVGVLTATAFLIDASLFSRSDIFGVIIGVLNTRGAGVLMGTGGLTGCACPPPPRFRVWFHTRYVGLSPEEFLRLLYGGAVVEYVYFTPVSTGLAAGAGGLTTFGACIGKVGCTSDPMGAGKILDISSSGSSTLTIGSRCAFMVVLMIFLFAGSFFFFLFFTNSLRYDSDLDNSVCIGAGAVALVRRWYMSSKSFCFLS